MKVQVVKLIWKKKSSEAKHRRKIFTSVLIRIVSDRLSVIIKQYSWPGYLDFHDSRRRIHRGNEGNSFAYSPCRPRRSKTLTCAPIRQCLYPRMCARWRNTSGGMTWAKTRIEMCFFSRRLPTRNYTRVPLSSTLAFFLSLVEFALARPATGKRIAAEWFIWPWWSRWWLVYGKGVLAFFSHDNAEKSEIKFLEDIPYLRCNGEFCCRIS